ncbi:Integrin-alpha FG-GAP repeat-containing protein 2 [Eufriesea mexicana]|nr:Integrin-alpha FG-GAP repeat-containing protein 2 [Eufriesea mexicana]
MRAVSFVKRLQWDLPGTVCRYGLTIGDVDNDGDNELVVGTAEGELYIFKGSELWQKIPGLGLVTSVAIGDIFNYGRNALVVICGDGWAHIYYSPRSVNPSITNVTSSQQLIKEAVDQDGTKHGHASVDVATGVNITSSSSLDQIDGNTEVNELSGKMECVHVQRIPTNTKMVLVADVDKDGANEMILGLTDRVVRSYRWSSNLELGRGKLVGLNKWECANQIGTVTLQHMADGTPTLLVAQPGGTFMRIKCNPEDCHLEDETQYKGNETAASCVDYQTLGISRMRNQNISTEIIGDLECIVESKVSNYELKETLLKSNVLNETQHGKPYALATLDGTIMLVKDEVILWSMQVDHQIFALCRLDVTGDGSDEIVACAWDGQTYILDQQRNSVRFQFEEPVRAFCTGDYNVTPGFPTPCLVYNSFNNKIFLYYDVILPSMVTKPFNPIEELDSEEKKILDNLLGNCTDAERQQKIQELTECLLYGIS